MNMVELFAYVIRYIDKGKPIWADRRSAFKITKKKSDVLRHVHSSSSSHDQLVTPSPLMDAEFTAFAASKGSQESISLQNTVIQQKITSQ